MTSFVNNILDTIDKKTAKESYVIAPENRVLKAKGKNEAIDGGMAIGRDPASVKPATGGGGGISSPLTETDAAARTYWDTVAVVLNPSGLVISAFKPVKNIAMTDASGAAVVFSYKSPTL